MSHPNPTVRAPPSALERLTGQLRGSQSPTPDMADDDAALANLDSALARTEVIADKYQQNVAPRLANLRDRWGLTP